MNKNRTPKNKPHNKFIRLTGVGLQMGITIYFASFFGKKLDTHFELEKNYFTLGLILFAFIGSFISLLIQLKKINDN
mgnify:CR=1 FL=1